MQLLSRALNKFKGYASLAHAYYFDFARFATQSGMVARRTRQSARAAHLVMLFHRIEKGLSFRDTRLGFGEQLVRTVTSQLESYIKKYGVDDVAISCWKCLKDYHSLHRDNNALNADLSSRFEKIEIGEAGMKRAEAQSAVRIITREEVHRKSLVDFKEFAFSRVSVRDFADEAVDIELLYEAARIAQKTPSVCNRQGWRTHIYSTPDACRRALACQGGNRGFGELVRSVVIITGEVEHFFAPCERNQGFIDGALYAMTFTYALHSLGLATCCLNLSLTPAQELRLRTECGVGANELPIMMIAVGHYRKQFKTANSERKSISSVVILHE